MKDKVYMRPPPKKRTKEIREMMKNEEDVKLTDTGATDLGNVITHPTVHDDLEQPMFKTEAAAKKVMPKVPKKRIRKPQVKNEALLEKVAEFDSMASKISGDKLYRCCFCDSEFLFAKRALSHVVATHEITVDESVEYVNIEDKNAPTKDSRVCDICGYKTKECGIYYIHFHKYFRHGVPLPRGWKPFTCDLCKKEFFTKFQLREHKLIHFEDNPFVCNTCGTGFKSRTCLNSHIFHKHNKVKRYKCIECPKSFKTRTQLKVHSRIHSGEKPFLCPVLECTYRSTTRGNMKLHLCSKHKFPNNVVKTYMKEELEESVPGAEKELEHFMITTSNVNTTPSNLEAKKMTRKGDSNINVPLEILVLSDVNDSVNMSGNEAYIQNNGAHVNTVQVNAHVNETFEMTDVDKTSQGVADIRDFRHLIDVGSMDHMKTSHGATPVDTGSLSGAVPMLMTDMHTYQQHADSESQMMSDLQRQNMNMSVNMQSQLSRSQVHEQNTILQQYEPQNPDLNRYTATSTEVPKLLDPHSREARMILKEAFESHGHRSLAAKSSTMHNSGFSNNRLIVENHSTQDTAHTQQVPQSPLSFHEAENLVIDLQDPTNQHDDAILSIRNQIQQLRSGTGQFRDDDSQLIRNDNVTEILQNIASSQNQAIDQSHFAMYHQRQSSPPAYPGVSGVVPVGDLDHRTAVPITTVTQSEGQGQMGNDQTMIQGQGYTHMVPHTSAAGQFSNDGTLYAGYYEEQYDIENY